MKEHVGLIYAVLGCISMISGLGLSISYLCHKSLRKNPGMLIF